MRVVLCPCHGRCRRCDHIFCWGHLPYANHGCRGYNRLLCPPCGVEDAREPRRLDQVNGPDGIKYGLRRAGDFDCGALADDLQTMFGEAVSSGGHPYAAVCAFKNGKEAEVIHEICRRLEVEAVLWTLTEGMDVA